MADIKPTAAVTATVSPVQSSAAVTPVEATVTSAPDRIQQITRQIQVSGTISLQPTADASTITLTTAMGALTLALPQLPQLEEQKLVQQLLSLFQNQRPLTVVIQPGDPPNQAFLLLPQATATVAQQPVDSIGLTQPTAPLANVPVTTGTVLNAVVLPSAVLNTVTPSATPQPALGIRSPNNPANTTPAAASPAAAAEVPTIAPAVGAAVQAAAQKAAATLPNLIMANEVTPGATAPTSAVAPPASAPVSTPNLSPATPAQQPISGTAVPLAAFSANPPSLSSLLQPGHEVTIQVNTVVPPSATTPIPTGPNQIVATVVGTGPNGQLILQAGDTTLYVRQPANVPVGTNLLLTVQAAPQMPPAILSVTDNQSLTSLQQIISALAQIDPALARQVIETSIPQPSGQFSSGLLFFLNILKQGDSRGFLGSSALENLANIGKFELISKLTQDMHQAGQAVRDGVVGEWKSYPIPVYVDGQLQNMQLYVHNDSGRKQQNAAGNSGPSSVRFLIDVNMSRLGPIQLDGFVQPKKLDMIVRSTTALPPGLPQELRDTYTRTLDALGYTGGLGFQAGRQHWLVMKNEGTSREA